ncbi:MAG: calcium-binding protein [Cyanobacteria bacterium P01_F01_bin.150]
MSSDANMDNTNLGQDLLSLDALFLNGFEESDLSLDLLLSDESTSEGFDFDAYSYLAEEIDLDSLFENNIEGLTLGGLEEEVFEYIDFSDYLGLLSDEDALLEEFGDGTSESGSEDAGSSLLNNLILDITDPDYRWEPDIVGDDGANQLVGTDEDEWIDAKAGNDTVNGGMGMDYIYGGDGDDIVNGDEGDDDLEGGDGNDTLNGGKGNDWLWDDAGDDSLGGGSGNDWLSDGAGNDTLDGGDGDDSFELYEGNNIASGGEGDDTFYIYGGITQVTGGNGNDIFSLDGYVWEDGEDGDNSNGPDDDYAVITDFQSGVDKVELNGLTYEVLTLVADGNDTQVLDGDNLLAVFQNTSPDQLSEADFETYYWGDGEYIVGTQLDDTLAGTTMDDYIQGRDGNDLINGGDSSDELDGGKGNDTLNGGKGGDYLWGGDGDDNLDGGDGDDSLSDYAGNNVLIGGDGNDSIYVYGGNNTIDAGSGDDVVATGDGVTEVTLGTGSDIISLDAYSYLSVDAEESGDGETADNSVADNSVDDDYVIVTDFAPTEDAFEIFGVEYDDLTFEQDGSNTNIVQGDDLLAVLQGVNPDSLSEDNIITYDDHWVTCGTCCDVYMDDVNDVDGSIFFADDLYDSLGSGNEDLSILDMVTDPMIASDSNIEPTTDLL